jgi:hypothetical protein
VPAFATAVPALEVIVGGAFVLGAGGQLGAVAAGVTILSVTAGAALSLGQGRQPDCGCLGTLNRQVVSWRLVVRNIIFLLAIALVGGLNVMGPGIGVLPWPAAASAVTATGLVFVVAIDQLSRHRAMAAQTSAAR